MTCFFKGLQTYPYLVLTVNLRDFLDVYDFMCTVPCKFGVSFILLECRPHGMHVQFWLTKKHDNYIFYITLYELSPGNQVSSSRSTFLVKIQSKSVHGVCSLHFACQNKHIDDWKYVNYVYCYAKPFQTFPAVPDDACSFWQTGRTRG